MFFEDQIRTCDTEDWRNGC